MANKDNPKKGADFESAVERFLCAQKIQVRRNFSVLIGAGANKRPRKFDLGSDDPKVVVECKSHAWTEGHNAPSAKMAVWNEAMYYFSMVPNDHRKMFFVLLSRRKGEGESLAHYYLRRFSHLVAHGVEIWELDMDSETAKRINSE